MNSNDLTYYVITVLAPFIATLYTYLSSLVKAKMPANKRTNLNLALSIAEKLSKGIVANVAVDKSIPLSDAKKAAMAKLDGVLQARHINLSSATISRYVEAAYQSYKTAGGDNHVMNSPYSEEHVQAVLGEPEAESAVSSAAASTSMSDNQALSIAQSITNSLAAKQSQRSGGAN